MIGPKDSLTTLEAIALTAFLIGFGLLCWALGG